MTEHAHDDERDDLKQRTLNPQVSEPEGTADGGQLISSESELPEDEVEKTRELMGNLLMVPRDEVRKRG